MIQGNGSGSSRTHTCATDSAFADLTVLILSRNRPQYLERQVRWWSKTAAQILIADGSDEPNEYLGALAQSIGQISYTHQVSITDRLSWGAQEVSTKYTLIAGDDDLYLFSGVRACLAVLENDKQIGTCMGQAFGFRVHQFTRTLGFYSAYNENVNYQVTDTSPISRTKARAFPYTVCCFYAVQRSNVSKTVWQLLADLGEPGLPPYRLNLYLYELTYELVSTFLAPVVTTSQLMWLRSTENIPIRSMEGPEDVQFHTWLYQPASQRALENWHTVLLSELEKIFKDLAKNEISKGFSEAIEQYLRHYPSNYKKYLNPNLYRLRLTYELKRLSKPALRFRLIQNTKEAIQMRKLLKAEGLINTKSNQPHKKTRVQGRTLDPVELQEAANYIRQFHLSR